MSEKIAVEIEGKTYKIGYLASAECLRVHSKVAKLGFVSMVEALSQVSGQKKVTELLNDNADLGGTLLAALYDIIQKIEPEDVEFLQRTLSTVTWIDTVDGKAETPLSALPKHFADARDMPRFYRWLIQAIKIQIDPLLAGLGTSHA